MKEKLLHLSLIQKSWSDYPQIIFDCLKKNNVQTVLEIGAGPNPSLSTKSVRQFNLNYHLNDFSKEELEKGSNEFTHFSGDFLKDGIPSENKYDLIISQMVLEHINDPFAFHSKVFHHLNPGGFAIHFFATLYSLPAIFNLILPEFVSQKLVKWGQGRNEEYHGKFPAMYKWCKGPVKGFNKQFETLGYKILSHQGYVGHSYLINQKWIWPLERSFSKALLRLNKPLWCSNAILVLQKPPKIN